MASEKQRAKGHRFEKEYPAAMGQSTYQPYNKPMGHHNPARSIL
jgi:hypothetical protein